MQRRNFLIGAAGTAIGGSALVGSGAFDSVEADRNVDVQVTGDASSYLQITGDDEFVGDDSEDGELTIDLGSPGGEAFNPDAVTEVSGVVTIANEGTQDGVVIGFGDNQEQSVELDLEGGTDADDAEVTLEFADYDGDDDELDVGQTVNLDVTVDTTEDPGSASSDEDVTILATTE